MANGDLNPEEFTYFDTSRRRIRDQFALGGAQNVYQQGVTQNALGRSMGDFTAKWDQMRNQMPYGYAARGVLNSGIAQRGYSQYGVDRARALGNLSGQYQDQMGGLKLAYNQLGQVRDSSLADVDAQEAARRAAIAEMLRAAR